MSTYLRRDNSQSFDNICKQEYSCTRFDIFEMENQCSIEPEKECIGAQECKKKALKAVQNIHSVCDIEPGKLIKYFHKQEMKLIQVERDKIKCANEKLQK